MRLSYLYNGALHTDNSASLYWHDWESPQEPSLYNINMPSHHYRESHCKDKVVFHPDPHNTIFCAVASKQGPIQNIDVVLSVEEFER